MHELGLTFKNLDGSLDAFSYNGNSDSFVPFTFFTNQNLRLFDIKNVKSPYFGLPDALPIEYTSHYYSVKSGNGPLKYFYNASIEDVEIKGLENSIGCDFMDRPIHEDTIHFYNYSDPSGGLIRFSKLNKNYTKDNSIIPFDTSFQLKGYLRKLYFGDYNPNTGKIEAVFKDFQTKEYHFIESSNGARVENPINFQFFDDKVFIYNRRENGIRMIVFDPDATTSTDKEPQSIPLFTIYPNPASDRLEISIGERFQYPSDLKFRIIDGRGIEVKAGNINGSNCMVDVKDLPPGMYYVQILDDTRLIQTTSVSIIR